MTCFCGRNGEHYKNDKTCKECRKRNVNKYRRSNLEKVRRAVRRSSDKKRFGAPREELLKEFCQRCGGTNLLCIHHKDGKGRGHDNPNNKKFNLETLCNDCHVAHHVRGWSKCHNLKWQKKVKGLSGLSLRAVGRTLGIDKGTVQRIRSEIRKGNKC